MDEIFILVKYGNFSYGDLLKMPVYERKYFVEKLVESFQKS